MSLLKLAQAAVPQGLPVPGVARVWVEINSDVQTSQAKNRYVNIKVHGTGRYEKSTVLDRIMLTADGDTTWSLMGARTVAAIARASGRSLEGTLLTADETPAVSDEGIDELLELIADGEAIVRLKKNDKGYNEVGGWLDVSGENQSDAKLIALLGDADAIQLEERPARAGRPAPSARPAASAAPRPTVAPVADDIAF